jgi:hypothetical protein
VKRAVSGGVLGDIGAPQPIWGIGDEVAPDLVVAHRRRRTMAALFSAVTNPSDTGVSRQPGDRLQPHRSRARAWLADRARTTGPLGSWQ